MLVLIDQRSDVGHLLCSVEGYGVSSQSLDMEIADNRTGH